MDISKEYGITMSMHRSKTPFEVADDGQGVRTSRLQQFLEADANISPGGYRDIYAMSEAAGAPVTEAEVGGTVAGFVPGKVAGLVGAPGDITALATGLYKAAFPDEDQGRLDAFITQVEDVSNKFGSGATLGFLDDWATQSGISDEVKQGFMQGAEVGSFFGLGQGAKATGKGVAAAGKAVAEGAPARIAERGEGVTLGMGADPMEVIDPVLAAAGKLVNKVDEARAAYEASPNDPSLRKSYLTARHERDAQLSSMPPKEKFDIDTDYRMAHQPPSPQDGAARLDDMTGGGTVFPDDIYSQNALRFYGGNNPADQESLNIIQSVKGNPDAEIIIYRGVPQNVDNINPGDWVTLSKRYAEDHAESGYGPDGDQAGKVISQRIKVKDVYSGGNDLNEFGYFPEDIAEINVAKIEPPTETEPGIIAFHGSGADFDEFKIEKIGTGVGHQAYGNGFYFSSSEKLAESYKGDAGKLFMVNLGVKEENLLDWQQPLKQQPEILEKIRTLISDKDILKSFDYNVDKGIMGGNAYSNYIGKTKEETSKILKSVGIDGIKYLDIGSKGGGKTIADAPTNYVIFDDKAIKILEKYGIVGPVAITALGAAKQEGDEDANST